MGWVFCRYGVGFGAGFSVGMGLGLSALMCVVTIILYWEERFYCRLQVYFWDCHF